MKDLNLNCLFVNNGLSHALITRFDGMHACHGIHLNIIIVIIQNAEQNFVKCKISEFLYGEIVIHVGQTTKTLDNKYHPCYKHAICTFWTGF